MAALVTRGYGPGASIPLIVLRGYTPAVFVPSTIEDPSTAGLRGWMALELPHFLGGTNPLALAAELTAILASVAELGESVTIAGTAVDVIGLTPYEGVVLGGIEIEGRVTRIYCMTTALDAAAGALGVAVVFRGVTYAIGRIERLDSGLARVELFR